MNQQTISGLDPSTRRMGARFDGIRRSVVEPLRHQRIRIPELAIGVFVIAAAVGGSVLLNTGSARVDQRKIASSPLMAPNSTTVLAMFIFNMVIPTLLSRRSNRWSMLSNR